MCLEAIGFPNIFRNYIRECFTYTSFLVLINGSLSNFFKGARGLRQELMRAPPIHPGYGNAQPKVLRSCSREKTDFIVKTTGSASLPYLLCGRCAGVRGLLCSIRKCQIVEQVVGWFSDCIGTLDQQGQMFHRVFSLGSRNSERRVIDQRVSRSSAAYPIFGTATDFKQEILLFTPYLISFSKELGIGRRGFFCTRAGWSWWNRSYLAYL